ncbi:MAG: hypothetical protein ACR2ML_05615 [Solirubrobacteraceae bacterium]
MNPKHLAALLGFAFVVAWIAFGLGNALLCLLGAALFYAAAALAQGEIDLAQLQDRIQGAQGASPPPPTYAPPPRPPPPPRAPRVR